MPRRQFVADLQRACDGVSIAGVSDVRQSCDDGEFKFLCLADGQTLELSILIPELSDYPSSHMCMIYGSDNTPQPVAQLLDTLAGEASGKTVNQILELVSQRLKSTDRDGDEHMMDSEDLDSLEDENSDDDVEEFFPDYDDVATQIFTVRTGTTDGTSDVQPPSLFRQRIRADLTTAKLNGFKVGYVGALLDGRGCYVSVSIRFSKLGISEEAMEAWQVEPSEYLMLILSYPNGYKTTETVTSYEPAAARRNFGMRVGISSTYKATLQEAVRAFTVLSKEDEKRRELESQNGLENSAARKGFRDAFISRPLNGLLEEKFPQLLRYRYTGMTWSGAELFYSDHIGSRNTSELGLEDKYMVPDDVTATAWPGIVLADHIQDSTPNQEHSLPLVGMQFVLRHFVRCTEFCLICFAKMPDDLQAIKPYVCDNPLCLYQYMSLGFGPSIEHEIMSQPKVVDLLISFCYTSARTGKLKDFPTGLSLMVPPSSAYGAQYTNLQTQYQSPYRLTQIPIAPTGKTTDDVPAQKLKYNASTKEIMFDDQNAKCPVRVGDWIIVHMENSVADAFHCQVSHTSLYPTVKVGNPVVPSRPDPLKPVPVSDEFCPASFHMYDQNFDTLGDYGKREAIYALLDILPSVPDMSQYLHRKTQSSLSSWVDRLPPAALGVLRWIIASNRACIMQVTEPKDAAPTGRKGQDRLCGMPGWAQFRFAMGAPDKERRFIQAVRDTKDRLKLAHSTLFAFHGSPINNWHGIIREGLHFKDTAHGRAYGHGVYHSLDLATSLGYSGMGFHPSASPGCWPMSELKVVQAIALNEVVNAPSEFVSRSPHLVISHLDWIQTRYLFVKGSEQYSAGPGASARAGAVAPPATTAYKETKPLDPIEQDKAYTPRGVDGPIVIPRSTIAGARQPKSRSIFSTQNKRQKAAGSKYDPIELDADNDDNASVATLEEDLVIFCNEDAYATSEDVGILTPNSVKGKEPIRTGFFSKLKNINAKPLTNYEPGKLDYSTLPMLQQPTWATNHATRRLMKDFADLIKVQNKEPQHELGWHIDEEKMENMYQWIVEMHSFDPKLPLAQDMKKKDCKSIVMELRFGKDYPMSPPFVRVIRPRFLGFNQGGGGHVTLGGAMCMQLLTNDGWSAVSSIESVLLQVRVAITSTDPKPARLDQHGRQDYGVGEAVEAYIRACSAHGWTVPSGFKEMAYGGAY